MISVPQTTETIVNRSRFLSEAMAKGLLNYSSVARYIKPEIENMLQKQVTEASIVMALKRLENNHKPHHKYQAVFASAPDMTIRSNLVCVYYTYTALLAKYVYELAASNQGKFFFTYTQNPKEIVMLYQAEMHRQIHPLVKHKQVIKKLTNLSAITVEFANHKLQTPDIFYFFLKSLAWEDITVIEMFSTSKEVTFTFKEEEGKQALLILQSLFQS